MTSRPRPVQRTRRRPRAAAALLLCALLALVPAASARAAEPGEPVEPVEVVPAAVGVGSSPVAGPLRAVVTLALADYEIQRFPVRLLAQDPLYAEGRVLAHLTVGVAAGPGTGPLAALAALRA